MNITEAKTHLSRLVEQAARGEEIVITKAGKPIARLVALPRTRQATRKPGALRGRGWVADDFDAPLPEKLLRQWYGGKPRP